MCKTIKHKVTFSAPPATIYSWLSDGKKHSLLTGESAVISKVLGGRFSVCNGKVTGINVDLKPGQRIVQAWRAKDFPPEAFSMATFLLRETSRGGTELTLIHRGVPKEFIHRTEAHWKKRYWEPLKVKVEEPYL